MSMIMTKGDTGWVLPGAIGRRYEEEKYTPPEGYKVEPYFRSQWDWDGYVHKRRKEGNPK